MELFDDSILIENTVKGDLHAFEKLVIKYKSLIYTLVFRIVDNNEDAEEVSQDVFIKAFKNLESFNFKSKFATWLYRIAYNEAINKLKSGKKFSSLLEIKENVHEIPEEETDRYENIDKSYYVDIAMQNLSESERFIVTLFYYEDLSIKEISKITDFSIANIKVKLLRARQKLYDLLKDKFENKI
jgi:RNA polymerase sigma-70 factor (ECF subfamily)